MSKGRSKVGVIGQRQSLKPELAEKFTKDAIVPRAAHYDQTMVCQTQLGENKLTSRNIHGRY